MSPACSESDIQQFKTDGFLIVKNLLTEAEIRLLGDVARADQDLAKSAYSRLDASGQETVLAVRNDLGDDMYSTIARSRRIVSRMSSLLDGEVYHYHHKLNLKQPRVGGAWEWHQDYGYWYDNGCLLPDMGSCMIAIDRATQENGCLQVLRASHLIGRINHGKIGDQTGADLERVEVALQRFELVHVTLEPGDAVLFHSNLLHRSDQNHSDHPRWVLICCYNTRRNDPYKESRHPRYTPLDVSEDDAILDAGRKQLALLREDPNKTAKT